MTDQDNKSDDSKSDPSTELASMVLSGLPDHVVSAVLPNEAVGEVGKIRDTLGLLSTAAGQITPSAGLRERLAAALKRNPQSTRRSALVVMDMQCEHLEPGRPLEVPRARDIVPSLRRRIDDARDQGLPVVFLADRHEAGDPELLDWGMHNAAGSSGEALWPELGARPTDHVVFHRAYSGFFQTDLEQTLRQLDVNHVELTGCITEIHLYLTAADALMRGFEVSVPDGLQAGRSEQAEQGTLQLIRALRPVRSMTASP